jgi:hypothetical protein
VLRRIFGPRTDEVTLKWRKLNNEDLNYLYSSPNIVRGQSENNKKGSANSMYGGKAYARFWWGNLGKETTGGPRRRWKDNIKIDLQAVECGGMDCFDLAQDRVEWRALVNAAMNLWVP